MSERRLKLSMVMDMVDKITSPIRNVTAQTNRAAEAVSATQGELRRLGQQTGDIEHFRALRNATAQTSRALQEAQEKAGRLARQMQNTTNPTRKMTTEFNRARAAVRNLQNQQGSETEQLQRLRQNLNAAGVSTTRLNDSVRRIRNETRLYNEQLRQEQENLQRIARRQAQLQEIRDSMSTTGGLVGGAVGAASIVGFSEPAMQAQRAGAKLSASEGSGREQAEKYRDMITKIYSSSNYSMDETAEAIAAVTSSLGALGQASSESIVAITKNAAAINHAYGISATESVQVVSQLIKNGLVKNSTEAFDLIGGGLQKMSASMRGELPEILNEYGAHFSTLGFSGSEAVKLLVRASESGKIALDKTGDALKEFTLRGSDLSKSSVEVYDRIGLSADDMANAIVNGGAGAREALIQTANGLLEITDPAERANAAIALFGTPLEDLSMDKIPEFLSALAGAGEGMGNLDGTMDKLSQTLGGNGASSIELVGKSLMGSMMHVFNALEPQIMAVSNAISGFINNNPKIAATMAAIVLSVAALATLGGIVSLVAFGMTGLSSVFTTVRLVSALVTTEQIRLGASMMFTRIKALASAAATVVMSVAQNAMALATTLSTSATLRSGAAIALTHTRTVAAAGALLMMSGAQKVMAAGTVAMTGVQWALNAAMAANPIGLVIAAVIALIGLVALVINYWEPLGNFFSGLWDGIKSTFSGVLDWIKSAVLAPIEALKNTLGGVWDSIFGDDEVTHTVKKVAESAPSVLNTDAVQMGADVEAMVSPRSSESIMTRSSSTQSIVYKFGDIIVQAAPGMNAQEVAQEVANQLEKEQQKAARQSRTLAMD